MEAVKKKIKAKGAKRKAAPRLDYAQGALATVLRLTGSKSLANKVEAVDFRSGKP